MHGERLDRAIKKWTEISEGQPRLDPCAFIHSPPTIRLPAEALMCCRASFQRPLFCFLVLSLVGCDQNPQRKPREQARESREEVEKKLEDAQIRYLRNSRGDRTQMALGKSHSREAL